MRILLAVLLTSSLCFSQIDSPEITRINAQLDSIATVKADLIQQMEGIKLDLIKEQLLIIGLPTNNTDEEIITHIAMLLSYNETHEQANWVMHMILPDIAQGNFSRSNDFREDSLIATGSAQEKDYFLKTLKSDGVTYSYDGFGYDRGHLAPSADFRWSRKALSESYFYSNMSPQLGDFNRYKWAELEGWLRAYVTRYNVPLTIVTAPILSDDLAKVDRSVNGVSVPKYYVKAALDKKNNRAIGFVMANEGLTLPVEAYAVTIDSVEKLMGYDLFSGLDDTLENRIEASYDYAYWMPKDEEGDVVAIPLKRLPKKALNTYSIHVFEDDGKKHTVCGTVVSTKKHEKGHVFINLDKKFPNQIFSVSIFESNINNFDYEPEIYLMDQEVCFTGLIGDYDGTTNMVIENGKQVKLLGEY